MTKEPTLSVVEKEFLYEESFRKCCSICGIGSFTHFHFKGDFPKDFYLATELEDGVTEDVGDGLLFQKGRLFQLKKKR